MARLLVALLATLAFSASSLQGSAQTRKCPDGKVYDPDKRKCVTPRGSH
jgi:hypothetical protein